MYLKLKSKFKLLIMRKLILIPLLLFAFFTTNAKDLSDFDYVVTKDATYFCQEISFGLLSTKCILQNGEVLNLKLNEVRAYKKDGRIFERMPVYKDDKITGSSSLMELIGMKGELKLFHHVSTETSVSQMLSYSQYFIFRNGDYILQLTDQSGPGLLKFFGLTEK